MNTSDINVSYTIVGNQVTITSFLHNLFDIAYMVVCFLSSLPLNTSHEIGNIETFLCNDSYYPFTSIGTRYSYIQPNNYIKKEPNCIRLQYAPSINLSIQTNDTNPLLVIFLNSDGIVRGPKSGIVTNTSLIKYSLQYVRNVIQALKNEWNSRRVSAGTIEAMIPDLLMHKTQCIDEETVIRENRTIYDHLGPDPRNPLDPTRNKGIFPKCSSKGCFNGEFASKFNGRNYRLHDHMFRVNLALQLADRIVANNYCLQKN